MTVHSVASSSRCALTNSNRFRLFRGLISKIPWRERTVPPPCNRTENVLVQSPLCAERVTLPLDVGGAPCSRYSRQLRPLVSYDQFGRLPGSLEGSLLAIATIMGFTARKLAVLPRAWCAEVAHFEVGREKHLRHLNSCPSIC